MSITLGPILALTGSADQSWEVTAVVVFDGEDPPDAAYHATPVPGAAAGAAAGATAGADAPPPDLTETAAAELLETRGSRRIARYRFDVERRPKTEQTVHYRIGAAAYSFRAPAAGVAPRMGYGSCNGFADPATMKNVAVKNALWRAPDDARHRGVLDAPPAERLHLMLLGGDQIYADQIWGAVDCLKGFQDLDRREQIAKPFSDADEREVADFYLSLYETRWTQPAVREAFATIPCIMMWDDHDIFDGWGSYDDALLDSPTYRAIFRQAARHFDLFQRHAAPEAPAPSALDDNARTACYDLGGGVAVLALDMRTERRIVQVMSDRTWRNLADLFRRLGEADEGERPRHLLVMSSIPVVHPDMSWLEGPFGWFGSELEDDLDLRDHWNSHAHKGERLRLVHRLFALSAKGVRITFLSGDVHVAASGAVEWTQIDGAPSYANRIEQLTSSGIVHKGPPGPMVFFLEQLAIKEQEFDADTRARMVKMPGSQNVFIADRNWLALVGDEDGRLWAAFHVEGHSQPFERVIHPVGDGRQKLLDVDVARRGFTRDA